MRQTPLYEEHFALNGKVVDFHGWALPIQYKGILEEHHHTRTKVSLFDCSHMGEFMLRGAKAMRLLSKMVFNDMICLRVGRCRYSSILDVCGGIIDDLVAMKLSEDELFVVTNAGPLDKVSRILHRVCDAENLSSKLAKIDVQGPLARQTLLNIGISEAATLKYFSGCRTQWRGTEIFLTRAGYTGELGFELYIPNDIAVPLWRELVAQPDVAPGGLGARDTLRMEMGYTLYGQDVDERHTTLEAGMGRFIDWDCDFHAKEYLTMQRENGKYRVRTGIRTEDRRAPRADWEVYQNGSTVGVITSGTFGPSVGYGIGMAYLPVEMSQPGNVFSAGPKGLRIITTDFPFYKGGSLRD